MVSDNCLFTKLYIQQPTLVTTLRLSATNRIETTAEKNHVLMAVWITCWVFVVCLLNPVLPDAIYRVDPLALLAATLRTYQRAACDSEQLTLSCPRGTSISIELAQYGRAGDLGDQTLCHPTLRDNSKSNSSTFLTSSGTEIEIKPAETCAISGLQYTLLQSVVGACQKKRQCKFSGNTTIVKSGDPCYGIRKFIEIAYKCRPYEFRSKVACEDDSLVLMCNPYSRIAIYSASFGHIDKDSVQCERNNTEVSEEACLVSYATETVMQICHGRRRCTVAADAGTFGRPCKTDVRMHLKVVFTCLPRKVLKERYETAPESDEPQSDLEIGQDELYDEDQFYRESEAVPPKVQGAIPNAAAKPFNLNGDADILSQKHPTSTLMTPLLKYNESTLEDSKDLLKTSMNKTLSEKNYQDTTIQVTEASFDSGNDEINFNISEASSFYKRRCQMTDDWGLIGLNCTDYDMDIERVDVYGFMANWMQAYAAMKQNQEELYLYLVISVAAGVLICLTLVIGRLTLLRENICCPSVDSEMDSKNAEITNSRSVRKNKKKIENAENVLSKTHNYEDDISDIETDIDLRATTTPSVVCNYNYKDKQTPTYLTSAATSPHCPYKSVLHPTSETNNAMNIPADATSVEVPRVGGLMMQRHVQVGSVNTLSPPISPPSSAIYTNPDDAYTSTISGTIAMTPRFLVQSPLSGLPNVHHNASSSTFSSYLSGSTMGPGHHQHPHHNQHAHLGNIRRYMPANVSVRGLGTIPVITSCADNHQPSHMNMTGIPSASQVYYDSTIPRNLVSRPTLLDSQQSPYGRSPAVSFNLMPTSVTIGTTTTISQVDNKFTKLS